MSNEEKIDSSEEITCYSCGSKAPREEAVICSEPKCNRFICEDCQYPCVACMSNREITEEYYCEDHQPRCEHCLNQLCVGCAEYLVSEAEVMTEYSTLCTNCIFYCNKCETFVGPDFLSYDDKKELEEDDWTLNYSGCATMAKCMFCDCPVRIEQLSKHLAPLEDEIQELQLTEENEPKIKALKELLVMHKYQRKNIVERLKQQQ